MRCATQQPTILTYLASSLPIRRDGPVIAMSARTNSTGLRFGWISPGSIQWPDRAGHFSYLAETAIRFGASAIQHTPNNRRTGH